jgi:hypothetical protein
MKKNKWITQGIHNSCKRIWLLNGSKPLQSFMGNAGLYK